jgi:hypothetical protein
LYLSAKERKRGEGEKKKRERRRRGSEKERMRGRRKHLTKRDIGNTGSPASSSQKCSVTVSSFTYPTAATSPPTSVISAPAGSQHECYANVFGCITDFTSVSADGTYDVSFSSTSLSLFRMKKSERRREREGRRKRD